MPFKFKRRTPEQREAARVAAATMANAISGINLPARAKKRELDSITDKLASWYPDSTVTIIIEPVDGKKIVVTRGVLKGA